MDFPSETVVVAAIERGAPSLVQAREIIAAFQTMVRRKLVVDLDPWLERAGTSLVAPFAKGIIKDKVAVSAAISSNWSNGQTEGQITKLKLVKRQMYGRGKLDLLQARLMAPREGLVIKIASEPNGEHGAAARDLFLAFAQPVRAAKVRRDARQHVTETTRDLEPRVAVNKQLSAIGHLAAPFRRTGDHLAGQLPVPNCLHDKSALSG